MREVLWGALAMVMLAASLGVARVQLVGPALPLLGPYRPAVKSKVELVDLARARQLFDEGQALFIDAREKERYDEGHVAGAVNLADISEPAARTLPYSPFLVVYCDGPECGASTRVAEQLAAVDVSHVLIFMEGWPAWQAAGYPTRP